MIRTIWNDPDRFKKSYFPEDLGGKLYLAGDGAVRDATTGYFTIMGRIDDVLNVSGHRMGTMEIESALVSASAGGGSRRGRQTARHQGRSHRRLRGAERARPTGDEAKQIVNELRNHVGHEIGPIAKPEGNPLRRQPAEDPLRQDHAPPAASLAKGEAITQDTSTLENPAILDTVHARAALHDFFSQFASVRNVVAVLLGNIFVRWANNLLVN
jgi:acetyl-CoA synthetase